MGSALEAHGTGTALGDPIEVIFSQGEYELINYLVQVGAAKGALCEHSRRLRCASLKSNMGHLEICAAATGLVSLRLVVLDACVITTNAQLRLCVHL